MPQTPNIMKVKKVTTHKDRKPSLKIKTRVKAGAFGDVADKFAW